MSEEVARVIRDIRIGRVLDPAEMSYHADPSMVTGMQAIHKSLLEIAKYDSARVIDATSMYWQIAGGPAIDLYADFCLMPVWEHALIGYVNEWGNVHVIQTYVMNQGPGSDEDGFLDTWESVNPIDWDAVKKRYVAILWGGGMSQGKHIPTAGPLYRWDAAVYEDGQIADLRWTALFDMRTTTGEETYLNAMLIWLQTYTLAGCTNVELVTPLRRKPERKRLERLGVIPQKIVIKKTSKSYRRAGHDTDDVIDGVPQRFVRGHYARYGPEFDRGLLFGKYAGKFWIPARAVGASEREIDYATE